MMTIPHKQTPLEFSNDLDILEPLFKALCSAVTMAQLLVIRKEWTVPSVHNTDTMLDEMARVEALVIV